MHKLLTWTLLIRQADETKKTVSSSNNGVYTVHLLYIYYVPVKKLAEKAGQRERVIWKATNERIKRSKN